MRFKTKLQLSLVLAITCILGTFPTTNAFAYVTINNHVLNGGVGNYGYSNRYYFINASASGYTSYIDTAMGNWVHTTSRLGTTTPISFLKTSTQNSSVMDIYSANTYPASSGISGFTQMYLYQNTVNAFLSNWGWGKITINYPVYSASSVWEHNHTIAHEMGHVMGLNENNSNTSSVMCQTSSGCTVSAPMLDDCNGINYLY
ncbi:MAG: Matrixin [Clostridiaceae bacterium]|nr:Matrixin [Clostridiaceae bacterium]